MEMPNCQYGTPNGILIIIAIGEVKGIIDNHNVSPLSGFSIMAGEHTIARINGMVNIVVNCVLSVSLSTMPPIAENNAA